MTTRFRFTSTARCNNGLFYIDLGVSTSFALWFEEVGVCWDWRLQVGMSASNRFSGISVQSMRFYCVCSCDVFAVGLHIRLCCICGCAVYAVVLYLRLCCICGCAVYTVVLYMRLCCIYGCAVYTVVLYLRFWCICSCTVHAMVLYIYVFASAVQRSVVAVVPTYLIHFPSP